MPACLWPSGHHLVLGSIHEFIYELFAEHLVEISSGQVIAGF